MIAPLRIGVLMKSYMRLLVGLLLTTAVNNACMPATDEKMTILKQIRLSRDHSAIPYRVIQASNGDFIVAGSTDLTNSEQWATRVSPNGDVRWEFVPVGENAPERASMVEQRFYNALELVDKTTLFCGVKTVKGERLVLLDHLAIDGSLLGETLVRPQKADRYITDATCFQWDHRIALIGIVHGAPTGGGWLAVLNEQLNIEWEKVDDLYSATDVITAAGGALFVVNTRIQNPNGGTTSIIKIGPKGEIIARHEFTDADNPKLVCPVELRSDLRVALRQDTLKTQIVDLDDLLQSRRVLKLSNAGVKKPLELPDGSLAIFGSRFQNGAVAAVTRVYQDGSSKAFLVQPEPQSGWYYDAVYIGSGKQFAAVRSVEDGQYAVLDLISFE